MEKILETRIDSENVSFLDGEGKFILSPEKILIKKIKEYSQKKAEVKKGVLVHMEEREYRILKEIQEGEYITISKDEHSRLLSLEYR